MSYFEDDVYENSFEPDDFETLNQNEANDYRNEGDMPDVDEESEEAEFRDDNDYGDGREMDDEFQDPGGESALRRETASNPRNLPCPTCGVENKLTPKDHGLGYQCDSCANQLERGY